LTLLLDLILLKRAVYRHLLYNRGVEPRRIGMSGSGKEDNTGNHFLKLRRDGDDLIENKKQREKEKVRDFCVSADRLSLTRFIARRGGG
jgi:hypothetical protein